MSLSKKLTFKVYARDGFKCRHCNNRNTLEPHHVIYRSHGGSDDLNNLLTLCHCCHIEGVHRHRLLLEVLELTPDNLRVKFARVGNWRPT